MSKQIGILRISNKNALKHPFLSKVWNLFKQVAVSLR